MAELPIIDTILAVHDQVVNAPAAGITSYHTVTSNINWQIVSSDPWLTLSVDSGLWNHHIWLQAAANTGAPRTATVTVSGGSMVETITVSQDGSAPTEVNLHSLEAGIKLYPNPNNGHFTLEVTGCEGIQSIYLLDMLGKQITTIPVHFDKVIDVSENLSPGIYFVRVQSAEGNIIKKVIIE